MDTFKKTKPDQTEVHSKQKLMYLYFYEFFGGIDLPLFTGGHM